MADPSNPPVVLYSVKKACAIAGIRLKDLREYERRKMIVPAWTDKQTGIRGYSAQNIYDMGFIRRALRVGMTLTQIRYMLRVRGTEEADLFVTILKQRQRMIDGLIADLSVQPDHTGC